MEKSPFSVEVSEAPWVLWEKPQSVIELNEKQTDSRNVNFDVHPLAPPSMPAQAIQTTGIERKQYMAILNRMHQAAGKVGAFAQWDSAQT